MRCFSRKTSAGLLGISASWSAQILRFFVMAQGIYAESYTMCLLYTYIEYRYGFTHEMSYIDLHRVFAKGCLFWQTKKPQHGTVLSKLPQPHPNGILAKPRREKGLHTLYPNRTDNSRLRRTQSGVSCCLVHHTSGPWKGQDSDARLSQTAPNPKPYKPKPYKTETLQALQSL